ncbi:RNA polymerase sigma-70 factor [Nocardiopsis potens]|uniref:RNA polymerase sigma-70 factor n=1 Tax=Nocardiopsis potens TaxID=1246458 RepID=UPI00036E9382|nr:RNA polymerase sigma-70 factor [Nocardiopsis potens]
MAGTAGPEAGADSGEEVFERHRRLLFAVAYDMLGSVHDAEDCVQEAWLGWHRADRAAVGEPRAYLVRAVTNRALNKVRSAKARRETYIGPWLPEPLGAAPDAAERAERAEEVSYALLVVLETLGPVERAVFVLREVFGFPHAEIAAAVDRSEQAVRQIAHRARAHVRERRPRYAPDDAERRRLTERFLAASLQGDVAGLKALLAEDVRLVSDGGGKRKAALRPILGADKCARFLAAIGPGYSGFRLEEAVVGGEPAGLLRGSDGEVDAMLAMEVSDGLITRVLVLRNPDKLGGFRTSAAGPGDAARS